VGGTFTAAQTEPIECAIKILKQSVCGVKIILDDEIPNVLKIANGAPGQLESLHSRCRRRSEL
jgi:hypothetical protein